MEHVSPPGFFAAGAVVIRCVTVAITSFSKSKTHGMDTAENVPCHVHVFFSFVKSTRRKNRRHALQNNTK